MFASNLAPLPEVGADAAVCFDPGDCPAAAAAIESADFEAMRRAGLDNAARFSTDEMIRKLIAAAGS